jgi:eukaryotic-like serine/threonine-protein kinase
MRNLILACLATLLSCLPISCHAMDAHRAAMFRGNPQLTGVYDARPVYSISGVRFTFATGGPIRSTPAVVDGVLYFGSSDGNFYAVDANSGK